MLNVGLTGGIGSGKTTVARIFEVLGVPVFYSDNAAKEVMATAPVRALVTAAFGDVYPEGVLDRKRLASVVFNDPDALARLNAIVHPAVREAFSRWKAGLSAPYVVNEAAVLVESGGHRHMDQLVVVSAPEEDRIARVMARDGADRAQVEARMRNQLSEPERLRHATSVLMNDGRSLLIPQVLALHERLLALA